MVNEMRSKQDWSVGSTVKVGFMLLTILERVATPGNYRPDQYVMTSSNGRIYRFTPHYGLERFATVEQAREVAQ